ncbi:MAG: hypothetical protein IOMNBAOH_00719 [Rhodocyclaceae bacterium]|nr:hypothetical protein [Rhodocyclaceae bacterium]
MPRRFVLVAATLTIAALTGCASRPQPQLSAQHIRADNIAPAAEAPPPTPVALPLLPPTPRPAPRAETYSVVVNSVKVQELLFALARDARINVDVHPGITGTVTMNAIDQTLPQLLDRIGRQVDMRYELQGTVLQVMPDTPFLRTYRIDYVNLSRDVTGTVSINTQISSGTSSAAGTTGSATGTTPSSGTSASGNSSITEVKNAGRNRFWESLDRSIRDLLRETDKILPEGSSEEFEEISGALTTSGTGVAAAPARGRAGSGNPAATLAQSPSPAEMQNRGTRVTRRTTFREAASVIIHPETGVVDVRATSRQHEKIQEFLAEVMAAARRQVLIEATIAEVRLSDNYQQGIDWLGLQRGGDKAAIGQGISPRVLADSGALLTQPGSLASGVANTLFTFAVRDGGFSAAIRLLQSFGDVRVVSSPKLSVLNNQTALLKVVNNVVFFNIKSDTSQTTNNALTTVTTTPQSVSVGLVMSVTPQISHEGNVLLNVRPSISRVTSFKRDPNPSIPAGLLNLVPEIETREMESIMRVGDGEVAVLGGLMQDDIDYRTDAVPGLSSLPLLGNLFTHRNDTARKTELVIFLRPVVLREASIHGDFRSLRDRLPGPDFFTRPAPKPERGSDTPTTRP